MKRLRILAVGQLKTPHWREAAAFYKKRLAHTLRLEEAEIKDAPADLPLTARKEWESSRLLKLLRPQDVAICLDERGRSLDSRAFTDLLRRVCDSGKRPCFIIGGAYGLADEARTRAEHCLSFGPMTFPHEMARVLLLEQLYRAEHIAAGSGYHH